MVNSKFPTRQGQRWARCLALFALVCVMASDVVAQQPYQSNQSRIFSQPPTARVARNPSPSPTYTPSQPFLVEFADPPAPTETTQQTNKFENLNRTFQASATKKVAPTGKVQDIFGENPEGDIFGEEPAKQQTSPFQKVDPPTQVPENPFGEMTPDEPAPTQLPGQNPFNELPEDPSPTTPPMDTNPVAPRQVDPQLPPGSQFVPDPGKIDPNPPVPGETPGTRKEDPNKLPFDPEPTQPEEITDDTEAPSIFDSKEEPAKRTEEKPEDNSDIDPVPAPYSSRVYLPAKEPTDYVTPSGKAAPMVIPPGYYNQGMMANNPYANLPGPYGYAMPPQGYMPQMAGMMPPMPYGQPYGQCGPGCTPTNQCGSCNNCNSCSSCNNSVAIASNCGGCGSCGNCCDQRPRLVGSEVEEIGERIVETACVDACSEEPYTDVVSDCDSVCSNFASCYVGLFGGWSDLNEFVTRGDIGQGIYTEDSGYLFGVAIGQIQGRNLRTELEFSYRSINVNGLRMDGNVPSQFVGVSGDFSTFAGMFNGYWEFVDFRMEKIKPYIGGGIGFALGRPDLIQANGAEAIINDDDSSFAWQWMAGLNYKASPTLDAFVEYRYFVADSFRLDTEIPEVAGLGNGSGPFDYQSGNVLFGLRARF